MARGHKTPGSGRKKGTPNKRQGKVKAELKRAVEIQGQTPLEFMLSIQNDELLPLEFRADMAKAAAPYVHAKPTEKPPETPGGPNMIIIGEITDEQRIKALEALISRGKT